MDQARRQEQLAAPGRSRCKPGRLAFAIAAAFVFAGASVAAPPSAVKGAQISARCAACHGTDGFSVDTSIPNLAGQHYVYLQTQMMAFKQKTRNSPMMNEIVAPLTQEQIDDISAYYASIPVQLSPKRH